MAISVYNHTCSNKNIMVIRYFNHLLLYFFIYFTLYIDMSGNEKFRNFYEEMNYYATLACSKSNIDNVLSKLRNRYEEEFAFISQMNKATVLSPYFYFTIRCIPLQKITEEIKGASYGFRRSVLFLKYKFLVESHLKNCIDPINYNFGHYKEQHKRIWKLPNKRWVYLILRNIIKNPEYPYIIPDINAGYYKAMRILATDALSEAIYRREKVVRLLKSLVSMKGMEDELNNIDLYDLSHTALISLGVLGEKEFVNIYINNIRTLQIIYLFRGLHHIFYHLHMKIADLYVYTGQYKNALNIFRPLMFIGDKTFFYNMACLFSLMGKKQQALRMLRRSVKAGYMDLRWLRRDKELDLIRNTKQFKRMERYLEKKLREQ